VVLSGSGSLATRGWGREGVSEQGYRVSARDKTARKVFVDVSVRPVLKALGDETRFQIYCWLCERDQPVTITEVAGAFHLHPNTVRPHLDHLYNADLVRLDTRPQGTVGRPQHRYTAVKTDIELRPSVGGYEFLAHLLAETCCRQDLSIGAALEVGRCAGRDLVSGENNTSPDCRIARKTADTGVEKTGENAFDAKAVGMKVLVEEMDKLGFEPAVDEASLLFANCPFRALAQAYPDLVCSLHEGIVTGVLESTGGRLVEFCGFDKGIEQCSALIS